jgi:hypothetical protein
MNRMRYQSTNWQTIGGWVARVLRVDFSAFDEVRGEPSATVGAVAVVLGASLLAGLGSWLWAAQTDYVDGGAVLLRSFLLGSVIQTGVWFLWVYLVYQVLVRGYDARVEFGELVRSMGFAFAPAALGVLVAVAPLSVPLGVVSLAMAVLFTNVAVQQASDCEAGEATLANLTGFGAFAIAMGAFANVWKVDSIGGLAPGVLFFSLDI